MKSLLGNSRKKSNLTIFYNIKIYSKIQVFKRTKMDLSKYHCKHFDHIPINYKKRKHKSDPKKNKRSFAKLKSNAEEIKHILSTMERAHCSIECLCDGIDFDYYLTRQRFEGACNKIYQEIFQPIDDLLSENQMTASQIKQVCSIFSINKIEVFAL